MTATRDALYRATRDFMARDYAQDVADLNELIRKERSLSANLRPEMPPIPFTGDPFKKKKGDCVLLFGINPRWHDIGTDQYEKEFAESRALIDSFHDGNAEAFYKYLDLRRNYFCSGMKYGRHFTFLENRFRENWYSVDVPWEMHVQSMDCIPWFSTNTNDIDIEEVIYQFTRHPAFIAYIEVIKAMIDHLEPNWIHLNGKMGRLIFEGVFGKSEFDPMFGMDLKKGVRVGHCEIGDWEIPVLSHNFASRSSSPNTIEDWRMMASIWNDWLGLQE